MKVCPQHINVIIGHLKVKGQNFNILIFWPISVKIIEIISVKIFFITLDQCIYSSSDILCKKIVLHCFTVTLNSQLATKIGQSSNLIFVFLINIKVYTKGFRVLLLNGMVIGCKSINLYPIV